MGNTLFSARGTRTAPDRHVSPLMGTLIFIPITELTGHGDKSVPSCLQMAAAPPGKPFGLFMIISENYPLMITTSSTPYKVALISSQGYVPFDAALTRSSLSFPNHSCRNSDTTPLVIKKTSPNVIYHFNTHFPIGINQNMTLKQEVPPRGRTHDLFPEVLNENLSS